MVRLFSAYSITLVFLAAAPALAAAPKVEDALKLTPVQQGIDYSQPSSEEIASSTIKAEKIDGATAWVVRGPDGLTLREFADSNGDNVVDRWSYFRDGIEVYRDVDSDFDGKADRFCWLQTGGSRVGVDTNKDGKLDEWQRLSPEEAAEEAVLALRSGDADRFARLTLTASDVEALAVSDDVAERLKERMQAAGGNFAKLAKSGKVDNGAEFTDFGGLRPGAVPAGSRGAADDLLVYENAWAMVRNGDEHQQMQLGTMVRVGDVWKLLDAPSLAAPGELTAGFFYDSAGAPAAAMAADQSFDPPSEAMQELLAEIEKLDTQIMTAGPEQQAKLNDRRASLLEKLAEAASTPAEKAQWYKQLADTISAAVQMGTFDGGVERLDKLQKKLAAAKAGEDVLTHIEFRRMQAAYGAALSDPKADYAKIQEAWLQQLEGFVGKHKQSEHVAEALLQLAMASEFAGEDKDAQSWYSRIVKEYPNNPTARKAAGALRRLTSVGRSIDVSGPGIDGGQVDLSAYRGKVVLVYFWSTTLPTVDDDNEAIADLLAKYGGKFDVIGVNLDGSRAEVQAFLKEKKLPWKQIYEAGGFDNRLANDYGVITLPLMMLVDPQGKVVSNNLQTAELSAEVKNLVTGKQPASASTRGTGTPR